MRKRRIRRLLPALALGLTLQAGTVWADPAGGLAVGDITYTAPEGTAVSAPRPGPIQVSLPVESREAATVTVRLVSAFYDRETGILRGAALSDPTQLRPGETVSLFADLNAETLDGAELRHYLWGQENLRPYILPLGQSLTLQVRCIPDRTVLTWDGRKDLAGIELYDNGALLASFSGSRGGYILEKAVGEGHAYQVKGVDAAGHVVAFSNRAESLGIPTERGAARPSALPDQLYPNGVSLTVTQAGALQKTGLTATGDLTWQTVGDQERPLLTQGADGIGLTPDHSYLQGTRDAEATLETTFLDQGTGAVMVRYQTTNGWIQERELARCTNSGGLRRVSVRFEDIAFSDGEQPDILLYRGDQPLCISQAALKNANHRAITAGQDGPAVYLLDDTGRGLGDGLDALFTAPVYSDSQTEPLEQETEGSYRLLAPWVD